MNFGVRSLAAPNAASSSLARYSLVARPTASASSFLFHRGPCVDRCLLASGTNRLASTAKPSPPTRPTPMHAPTTRSNTEDAAVVEPLIDNGFDGATHTMVTAHTANPMQGSLENGTPRPRIRVGITAIHHACNVQRRGRARWTSKDFVTRSSAISRHSVVRSHGHKIGRSSLTPQRRLTLTS